MRLSLLRAPKAPDAHADMGHHKIRWAIMPHIGPLGSQTVRTAYNFNNPMGLFNEKTQETERNKINALDASIFSAITLKTSSSATKSSSSSSAASSLILDTIKRPEDDPDVVANLSDPIPFPSISSARAVSGSKSIILRIYESLGGKSRGVIGSKWPIKKAFKTNILEDDLEELDIIKGTSVVGSGGGEGIDEIKVELRPFEVATFRLEF